MADWYRPTEDSDIIQCWSTIPDYLMMSDEFHRLSGRQVMVLAVMCSKLKVGRYITLGQEHIAEVLCMHPNNVGAAIRTMYKDDSDRAVLIWHKRGGRSGNGDGTVSTYRLKTPLELTYSNQEARREKQYLNSKNKQSQPMEVNGLSNESQPIQNDVLRDDAQSLNQSIYPLSTNENTPIQPMEVNVLLDDDVTLGREKETISNYLGSSTEHVINGKALNIDLLRSDYPEESARGVFASKDSVATFLSDIERFGNDTRKYFNG